MIKQFMIFLLSVFVACSVNAEISYHNALDAQERGDYTAAAQAWKELASTGDPVAQFNLALLYQNGKGVKADTTTAQHWLTLAARQGLAEAYKQLNNKSVSTIVPATVVTTHTVQPVQHSTPVSLNVSSPIQWVNKMNPENYTVQLVSSTNEDVVMDYYKNSHLEGKAGYFRSKRQGQLWYTLVYGEFETVAEANMAVEKLPIDLKKWSPWIRNVSDIKKIMK